MPHALGGIGRMSPRSFPGRSGFPRHLSLKEVRMSKRGGPWVLTLALGIALSGRAVAQGTQFGTLNGNVPLDDGSPAAGVQVTVTSPSLQGERSTVTQGN